MPEPVKHKTRIPGRHRHAPAKDGPRHDVTLRYRNELPPLPASLTPTTPKRSSPWHWEDPRPVFPAFDGDAWEHVDWRRCEEEVRRLRSRIFKAVREGDMATAVDLQKLMLRSWHNTLVSVRQVTQRNTGRKTAGIDGLVALTSQARAEMAVRVHATRGSHQPSPVRRVYIPKASDKTKMRPLGIPVILDRCHQARVRNALEPEWEARFEPRSYGFRPGRGCHDAIGSLFNTLRGKCKRVWILDADLAGAFDKIDHEHLLKAIGGFPARGMIAGWLRAGISEAGKGHSPTEEGTPQGGVISPLLLNIALHGLEEAAGVRYRTGSHARESKAGSPALTRYADDLVVCCHSRQDAEQVKARLAEWLEPRGLAFNEAKTRIVPVTEGFDFLGFNLRRYPNGKLLIKPSATAIKRFRDRLAKEFRSLRGSNVAATGVRLWIGPGGGSSGCPRGPVTLRGCSCGAGRVFALADPLRSVRSACGVRAGVRGVPGTGLAGRGRGVPGMPGSRRGGLVPGREGARVRRRAGRSAAAILASRAGAAGAGGWRRARHRCSCGPAPS